MKIGILTFHDALNVGAVLQAFSLQTYLEEIGCESEFIDYSCRPKISLKRLMGRNIPNTINKLKDFMAYSTYAYGSRYNRMLKISKNKYTKTTISETNSLYDIFIVGSDQVWNFNHGIDFIYLLDFVKPTNKKIAYAVSMGQCNIPEHLHNELLAQIKTFDKISCRETYAVEFLMRLNHNQKTIFNCCDPTFLISKEKYQGISIIPNESHFFISYILNSIDSKQKYELKRLSQSRKLKHINLRNPDTCVRLSFATNKIVYPEEWLGYMINSEFIICGSFHATVFSLIFHKKFVVLESENIYMSGGNQRVRSLLRPLGLEYRCICHERIDSVLDEEIDWNSIDTKLSAISETSKMFLIDSLLKIK